MGDDSEDAGMKRSTETAALAELPTTFGDLVDMLSLDDYSSMVRDVTGTLGSGVFAGHEPPSDQASLDTRLVQAGLMV
jgi:hypothetical protein